MVYLFDKSKFTLSSDPTINGGVKTEMLASVTHLKAHVSDQDVIGACNDLLTTT